MVVAVNWNGALYPSIKALLPQLLARPVDKIILILIREVLGCDGGIRSFQATTGHPLGVSLKRLWEVLYRRVLWVGLSNAYASFMA